MKIWQTLNESQKDIVDILLENRGIKTIKEKKEFFSPTNPMDLTLKSLGISELEIRKTIKRIEQAIKNKEKIIIYGDYDADGVTATAIMWEALHSLGADVMPYIPDRFIEGYGINSNPLTYLKEENPELKLIITVDNGIVAHEGLKKAKDLGIDVIVTDHHQPDEKKLKAYAIIHTTKIAGSGVAWILARELTGKNFGLELTAIGTIADQMPLTKENRSFAKFGIEDLKKTKRVGLLELIKEAASDVKNIGTYEINYIIAPRINSMGRLKHGIESLRLLCTKDAKRAKELVKLVSQTNIERQELVEKTFLKVSQDAQKLNEPIIFLSHTSYHEGIIGLAAGRIAEEFYRPVIVISKGKKLSKGSARSIAGFDIVEAIREHSAILVHYGGHTMAAGFTIETTKIEDFRKRLNKTAKKNLTEELLQRKLKIDTELDFGKISWDLVKKLKDFEPNGNGNSQPVFATSGVKIIDIKFLGKDKKHLKLKLSKESNFFDAIGFGMVQEYMNLEKGDLVDIAYNIDINEWNGTKSLQLKLKDLKYTHAENFSG